MPPSSSPSRSLGNTSSLHTAQKAQTSSVVFWPRQRPGKNRCWRCKHKPKRSPCNEVTTDFWRRTKGDFEWAMKVNKPWSEDIRKREYYFLTKLIHLAFIIIDCLLFLPLIYNDVWCARKCMTLQSVMVINALKAQPSVKHCRPPTSVQNDILLSFRHLFIESLERQYIR